MIAAFCQKEVCHVRVCRLPVQSWANILAYLVNLGITYGSLTGAFGATNEELSEKYQSLVTPAGYAFAIWGAIFTWEGIFAVAQMCPPLSTSPVVDTVTPWWIFACCFQVAWTLFFAQDRILEALICMLGILLSLLTSILRTDFLPEISLKEYFLLRAPFSLHCGWIIAASVLNINVLADYNMSSQETLLMLAMVCLAGIAVIVALFTFAAPRADPLIGLVAAWALLGIYVELENPENLLNMNKFNYIAWPQFVIESVRRTALVLSIASACAALISTGRNIFDWNPLSRLAKFYNDLEGLELGETMYFKVMSQEEHKDDEFLGDAKLVVSPGGFNGGLVIMLRGRKAGTLRLELIVPPVFQDTSSAKKQPVVFDSSNPRDVVQAITWGTTEEAAHAVASLENILTSEGIRSRFVAAGIVQPLVSLLSDGSMDTRCKAAAALWNLGQCSVGKKILISSGGVQSLMQLFFEGTAYCKEESMAALLNIVSTEKVREELVAGGIVSWLMALLQSTSPKSLSHAIQLMGFLAEDQDVADNFMEASLTRLRQLLQDKNDDVRLQTAFAVSRIATADDRRQVLVEAEMVQPLNRLLKEGTYDCKAAAASAIGELANATDKRLFKKISMHLLEAEVLEPLLDLLGSHHDDCSSNASRALCILASTEKTGTAILERGALKPLVSLLKGKPQVSRILRVAKVLQALADFNRCGMDVALSQESSQQLMPFNCRKAPCIEFAPRASQQKSANPTISAGDRPTSDDTPVKDVDGGLSVRLNAKMEPVEHNNSHQRAYAYYSILWLQQPLTLPAAMKAWARLWRADSLALLVSVSVLALYNESVVALIRELLGRGDGHVKRAEALRSNRRLKVAILGAGMGGSALALWLRDLFGDQVDIAVITNGPVGGRCQAVELDGARYEAGASIISEVNVLFKALMNRFNLKKFDLSECNMPLAVYNGTRFLFSTASSAASGWKWAAKLLSQWKLVWRFGMFSLLKLKNISKRSCAPNFLRLYRALRDGATYAHPRELLSTLGHSCLCLTQHPADQWLVREMGIPGALVQELAEPGMRCNYGGQSCSALHALVGLVSIVGGISNKYFSVLGGNSQVAECSISRARPRIIRGLGRVLRKNRNTDTLYDPAFEVGYFVTPESGDSASSAAEASRGSGADTDRPEGLFMEAFHIVVVAHPFEHSSLKFEGCCETVQASSTSEFRRCTAHFLHGTLNLRYFAESQ
ncbi:unnamed protein product [Cladocopium goreaui]|uniref:Fructose-bisphosphate aldolase n=1 Tax=Cladocopium goreaui TaxID=2562237 RepID=A0A9P1M505_9DINO|nr:unnamed protein product [Cladocopium goreaui]